MLRTLTSHILAGGNMSRVCEMTGKSFMKGKKVSHSNRKSNKRWNANIQKVTMVIDGVKRRVRVSTKYLKKLKAN